VAKNEIHLGDIGTVFQTTIYDDTTVVDITGYTGIFLIFKPPTGDIKTQTAALVGLAANGTINYTTAAVTDLDMVGPWEWQAYITFAATQWHSDIGYFDVVENLTNG